ncbi:hypothetical protein HMPREF0576_1168 [Mobiluncus holmesii ATCC 35242]|uniref:Uncharacterized protein n=1 Tax=Mobiluncus holmesii ATCC 35242 TaxID=887899 RepID=E6M5N4_9ACTO|nr:hypothetical protein HMPREF0576_1168 [Mobiluncus holmesii ATCC 35242]
MPMCLQPWQVSARGFLARLHPWYLPSIYPEFLTLYYPEEGFI